MERVLLLGNNTSVKSAHEVLSLFNNMYNYRDDNLYTWLFIFLKQEMMIIIIFIFNSSFSPWDYLLI